jgi:hypothetical protein
MLTFLETLFDKYNPMDPRILQNLLLGVDRNESKVHFTKENLEG